MKNTTIRERIRYWFDNKVAKGTGSMVGLLVALTACVVLVLSIILAIFDDDSFFSVLWDSFATIVNAWMPYSEDGSPMYILLMAIGAVIGILFTSLLIGILTTAVEDKVNGLRNGSPRVIEKDHIVVLGIHTGIYRLIEELIATAEGKNLVIVVADKAEKAESEEDLRANIEIPQNIKLIYRQADPCDAVELSCCSIPDSRIVILNHGNDAVTMRSVLAVAATVKDTERKLSIITAVENENNKKAIFEAGNEHDVLVFHTGEMISRLIAHTCTQPGLSMVFEEMFGFDGLDFYCLKLPEFHGMTFEEICRNAENSIPVGFAVDRKIMLNPDPEEIYRCENALIYLADNRTDIKLLDVKQEKEIAVQHQLPPIKQRTKVLLLGCNSRKKRICEELREAMCEIIDYEKETADLLYEELKILCTGIKHVVLLQNENAENKGINDRENMRVLLLLRAIRRESGNAFNITAELEDEKLKQLMTMDDNLDFIVASDLSNMVIAQIADDSMRLPIFRELLSNEGKELYMIAAGFFLKEPAEMTCLQLRDLGMVCGFIFLGYRRQNGEIKLCAHPKETVKISPEDYFIVLADE